MENIFKGTGPALITPFKSTDFSIDYDALDRVIDYQISNGIDFIVALGTTAETVTMSHDERHGVYQFIRLKNRGRLPFMVGFGGNNTAEVVSHINSADFKGVDAILSVVPYYSKPSQEGIYRHFMALAEVSPVPIVLYNVPSRTGVNMTSETTLRLVNSSPKFVAIKEASGNIEQIKTIIEKSPSYFGVLSGDDSLIYDVHSHGGHGVISVMSNALPFETCELNNACNSNQAKAKELQQQYQKFIQLLFVEGNPAGVKAALAQKGLIENVLRLPLCPVSDAVFNDISQTIAELALLKK